MSHLLSGQKLKVFDTTGFRTSGLSRIPLKEALEGILRAGFNTVEFCLEHPEASEATIETAVEIGLKISSVSYHGKRDSRETRIEKGRKAIQLAGDCSVDVVVLGSPLRGNTGFRREAEELFELCLQAGVRPAWETEPGTVLNGLDDFYEHIVPLGPLAGINLDAGHLHIQGKCTVDEIRALGNRIHHVHVEGMKRLEHRHLIPGRGDMDWNMLLNGLVEAGYSGSLTIDLFQIPCLWQQYLHLSNIALKNIISYYESCR